MKKINWEKDYDADDKCAVKKAGKERIITALAVFTSFCVSAFVTAFYAAGSSTLKQYIQFLFLSITAYTGFAVLAHIILHMTGERLLDYGNEKRKENEKWDI